MKPEVGIETVVDTAEGKKIPRGGLTESTYSEADERPKRSIQKLDK